MTHPLPNTASSPQSQVPHYANFSRRIQAVILDSFILAFLFLITAYILSTVPLHSYVKIGIISALLLFLEPLLVSFTGASLGHHAKQIRIQNAATGKNLSIITALIRFVVKSLLGWLSVLLIFTTKRHQALHDKLVGSVVVMNKTAQMKGLTGVPEQVFKEEGYSYPSAFKRIAIILLYSIVIFFTSSIIMVLTISDGCLDHNRCISIELLYKTICGFMTVALLLVVISKGW